MMPYTRIGNLMDSVLTKHGRPVQAQGQNIRDYSDYLRIRAKAFGTTKIDYVRSGETRLKRLSVDKGLLRETEAVQLQIEALCRCEVWQLLKRFGYILTTRSFFPVNQKTRSP